MASQEQQTPPPAAAAAAEKTATTQSPIATDDEQQLQGQSGNIDSNATMDAAASAAAMMMQQYNQYYSQYYGKFPLQNMMMMMPNMPTNSQQQDQDTAEGNTKEHSSSSLSSQSSSPQPPLMSSNVATTTADESAEGAQQQQQQQQQQALTAAATAAASMGAFNPYLYYPYYYGAQAQTPGVTGVPDQNVMQAYAAAMAANKTAGNTAAAYAANPFSLAFGYPGLAAMAGTAAVGGGGGATSASSSSSSGNESTRKRKSTSNRGEEDNEEDEDEEDDSDEDEDEDDEDDGEGSSSSNSTKRRRRTRTSENKTFYCEKCNREYRSESIYLKHCMYSKLHDPNNVNNWPICEECGQRYYPTNQEQHLQQCRKKRALGLPVTPQRSERPIKYFCEKCSKGFRSKSGYDQHIKYDLRHDPENINNWQYCPRCNKHLPPTRMYYHNKVCKEDTQLLLQQQQQQQELQMRYAMANALTSSAPGSAVLASVGGQHVSALPGSIINPSPLEQHMHLSAQAATATGEIDNQLMAMMAAHASQTNNVPEEQQQ